MGEFTSLTATDGHVFDTYSSVPKSRPRGGLVVLQEVFGVNAHIRDVCERFSEDGFATVAPALFDRARKSVELDYDDQGLAVGRALSASKLTR